MFVIEHTHGHQKIRYESPTIESLLELRQQWNAPKPSQPEIAGDGTGQDPVKQGQEMIRLLEKIEAALRNKQKRNPARAPSEVKGSRRGKP